MRRLYTSIEKCANKSLENNGFAIPYPYLPTKKFSRILIMKMNLVLLGIMGAALLIGGGAAYVISAPPSVEVVTPTRGTATEAVYATGTVEPSRMLTLAPKTTGRMAELLVDEGQTVKKGDMMARFEDSDTAARITRLTAERDLAQREFDRKKKLFDRKFISADAYENSETALASAKAQLEEAKATQSYQHLIAPDDSTVIRRDGEEGDIIQAGQPVFYMSCCAHMRITAEVDEEDIPKVKEGQDVVIQSDAFPNEVFHGSVTSVTPKGDEVARSFRVRISIDDYAPLMIGMTAETNIIISKKEQALLIPSAAIGKNGMVEIVVSDNRIKLAKVKTGIADMEQTEILEGLSDQDRIVSPFAESVTDGQKVNVRSTTSAPVPQ